MKYVLSVVTLVVGLMAGWFAAETLSPALEGLRMTSQIVNKVADADCREVAADVANKAAKAGEIAGKAGEKFNEFKGKLFGGASE